ncbi:DUF5931 domain-containing protein [Pseudonocardia sp. HH130629-09]|uniref:DUF5931 domain-containing protein n=1 Tax=Pseudonocardia sp. HH130629-09 TaxID=1641402 RepID=UPI000A484BE9|nr:DUF5931 domain-containing protein [Pseudonocardia sp. HH130629-09]
MSVRPRRGALAVRLDDVEHPLEPFWRGVIAYRLLTLLTVVGVTLYHLRTGYERPLAAVGVLGVMVVWTTVTSWGYLGGLPGAPDRRGLLALVDLGVCVAVMATTRWSCASPTSTRVAPAWGRSGPPVRCWPARSRSGSPAACSPPP